jgi:hypothetical protein
MVEMQHAVNLFKLMASSEELQPDSAADQERHPRLLCYYGMMSQGKALCVKPVFLCETEHLLPSIRLL